MRRTLLRVGALVAALGLLFVPVVAGMVPSSTSGAPDPVTITSYDARYGVDRDGVLTATETIVGDFPYGRHGIFRYWDLQDSADKKVRLRPQDFSVTRDGAPEPYTMLWEQGRRFRVAKIGSADTFLSLGAHTYVLKYRIKGALAHGSVKSGTTASWGAASAKASLFNWQVVAGGWAMSMHKVRVRMDLPAKVTDAQCAVRDRRTCTVDGVGTRTLTLDATNLQPYTPISVRAEVPVPVPDRPSLPWPVALDRLLGQNGPSAFFVLAIALGALVIGYLWDRRSREPRPGYPVQFEPPAGLGPVQAAYVTSERVPRRALVATLLYQGQQGLTKLTRDGDDWVVEGLADSAAWDKVDDVTRHVGASLGVDRSGGRFEADGTISAGQALKTVQSSLATITDAWATAAGVQKPAGSETLGRILVILAAVAAVALTWMVSSTSLFVIPFAAFVVGGAGLLTRGVGRRRTLLGRDVWSRAGGFQRLLSTESAKERFDFSGRKELYTAFIPFAVAFDCADTWARKYQQETGEPAPIPLWYGGGYSSGHGSFLGGGDSFSNFESSLNSSISAYTASQSSSSGGGGGGFSGGGGGGGGGGGSW
ncbi:MAG TPA: DUF2207 domain-containing protein [Aeromicrobium sp.]|nr:DUF2207 domain-containing protein [Aeromicrobium sp.]